MKLLSDLLSKENPRPLAEISVDKPPAVWTPLIEGVILGLAWMGTATLIRLIAPNASRVYSGLADMVVFGVLFTSAFRSGMFRKWRKSTDPYPPTTPYCISVYLGFFALMSLGMVGFEQKLTGEVLFVALLMGVGIALQAWYN